MITIIIPFHNEENNVKKVIENVTTNITKLDYEIVAVNDNSNDKTGNVLNDLSEKNNQIKVIHNKSYAKGPTGLGNAIKLGFSNSTGNIVIPFMGDLSDDPKDIYKLVEKIEDGYDIVCGSRFMKGGQVFDYPLPKKIAHRLYNNIFSFLFHLKLKDFSNAFKAYKRVVIESIKPQSNGFEMTAELLLKAKINDYKITEVPVSWTERKSGNSKFGSAVKLPKLGYKYGAIAIKLWFQFIISRIKKVF